MCCAPEKNKFFGACTLSYHRVPSTYWFRWGHEGFSPGLWVSYAEGNGPIKGPAFTHFQVHNKCKYIYFKVWWRMIYLELLLYYQGNRYIHHFLECLQGLYKCWEGHHFSGSNTDISEVDAWSNYISHTISGKRVLTGKKKEKICKVVETTKVMQAGQN